MKLSEQYERNEFLIACSSVCGVFGYYLLVSAGVIIWPLGVFGAIVFGVSYYVGSKENFKYYEKQYKEQLNDINEQEGCLDNLCKKINPDLNVKNTTNIQVSITKSSIKESLDQVQDKVSSLKKTIDIIKMLTTLEVDQDLKQSIAQNLVQHANGQHDDGSNASGVMKTAEKTAELNLFNKAKIDILEVIAKDSKLLLEDQYKMRGGNDYKKLLENSVLLSLYERIFNLDSIQNSVKKQGEKNELEVKIYAFSCIVHNRIGEQLTTYFKKASNQYLVSDSWIGAQSGPMTLSIDDVKQILSNIQALKLLVPQRGGDTRESDKIALDYMDQEFLGDTYNS